jgi:methionyl-tRNA synthetase
VHHLSTTDYLQYEGTKFSKSKRLGVFGDQARDSGIKADVWRFYLLYHRPEKKDTEFRWDAFIEANNSHLNNNLGNLVNRVVKFVNNPEPKGYGGIVPDSSLLRDDSNGAVGECKREVKRLLESYLRHLDAVELHLTLVDAIEISASGNKLAQEAFKLPKGDREQRGAHFTVCLNLIRLLAALLQPFLPETAESIAKQLGVEPVFPIPDTFDCDFIRQGHQLGEASPLFTRIDPKRADDWKAHYGGSESNRAASG